MTIEQSVTLERPQPRSQQEIFADLRELAQRDGALHEISALVYRDWLVSYDPKDGRITDEPEYRWSTAKINKNELLLLVGLLIQSPDDRTYSSVAQDSDFAARADALLREFHDRVLIEAMPVLDQAKQTFSDKEMSLAPLAREAIYYGAEGFYQHQFVKLSRLRYRDDAMWLLQNVGLSILPIIDIATYIVGSINAQMSAVGIMRKEGHIFHHGDLTNSLLVSKDELRKRFGGKADAFIAKFATPVTDANPNFSDPFSVNAASIAPLIDLGSVLYVPNQYRLFESIYESPFYWMGLDKDYLPTLANHRCAFLEKTTAHILRTVFGRDSVYENVIIDDGSKDQAGEIDVLVIYGEFVLVVQAKSKRVTLKARAGDVDALKRDFDGAIQDPYGQALKCIELISKGAKCVAASGQVLKLPALPRFFPVVIISDQFPASTLLSRGMLARADNTAPVIWDLGVLDCVARLLPSPVEMLFYLQCRAAAFDNVISDSEYNFLGYHIGSKLALPPDADLMMLDRDYATTVDDFMIAADVGIQVERPKSILERLSIPVVSELLVELKSAEPRLASVVIDLYDFSSAALEDVSATILQLREEIRTTGKVIKAFSITTRSGGFTYAVVARFDEPSRSSAQIIGRKHKYDTRSDRWYVIVDSIESDNPVDGLLPLVYPWVEDLDEAENSLHVGSYFNSRREEMKVGGMRKESTRG
jgi:hypothetical protein